MQYIETDDAQFKYQTRLIIAHMYKELAESRAQQTQFNQSILDVLQTLSDRVAVAEANMDKVLQLMPFTSFGQFPAVSRGLDTSSERGTGLDV